MAPLPVGLTLGPRRALHHVAHVAGEAHHVVQVEAVAHRAAVDGAARVATADSCAGAEDRTTTYEPSRFSFSLSHKERYTRTSIQYMVLTFILQGQKIIVHVFNLTFSKRTFLEKAFTLSFHSAPFHVVFYVSLQ